jgi:hypothetical protein
MNLKKSWKKLKRNYEFDWKMSLILTMALIIGSFMFYQNSVTQTIYVYEHDTTTITVTISTTTMPTTTVPTTGTTTTPILPPGTWFDLKVRIVWADWVLASEYRRAEVAVSRVSDYVCVGSHTFEKAEYGWYEYTTFRVQLNGQIYLSMMSLHDPSESGHVRYEVDYSLTSAGYFGGQYGFYDYHAPMSVDEAGWLQWEWVLLS